MRRSTLQMLFKGFGEFSCNDDCSFRGDCVYFFEGFFQPLRGFISDCSACVEESLLEKGVQFGLFAGQETDELELVGA